MTIRVCACSHQVGYGAAIAAGEGGAFINGLLECSDYKTDAAGGCLEGGNRPLVIGPAAVIRASNATCGGGSCVLNAYNITMLGGSVHAEDLHSSDSGVTMAAQTQIVLAGDSTVVAVNVRSDAGGTIAACQGLVLRGHAAILDVGGWGGDAGAIQSDHYVTLAENSTITCTATYAASCGGCVSSDITLDGNAAIVMHNTSAGVAGGALGGCYPNQNIVMRDSAVIDVFGSRATQTGGALFAHNISFTGASQVRLRDSAAACGGAVATINAHNKIGQGHIVIDGSSHVMVVDAREMKLSEGCDVIMGSIQVGDRVHTGSFEQPCSACASAGFPPSKRNACKCQPLALGETAALVECCSQ
eukprot:COSAG02_NODE_2046_length_10017_cov_3.000403_10_plen_359_part_00